VGFGRAIARLRYVIALAWVAVTVAAVTMLPTVKEAQVGALGDLVPADADAIDAEIRAAERFGFPLLSRTVLVQRDPAGLSVDAQRRVITRAVAITRREIPRFRNVWGALPVLNAVGGPPFAPERATTAVTFLFFNPEIGSLGRAGLAELAGRRLVAAPGDALVGVTGAVPARNAQAREIEDALPLVELGTVLLVSITVGVHFRAVVAPLITLASVAIAYLVAIRLAAALGRAAGVSVPSEVQPIVVVLLFGIVTDYALFYLSRMRKLLADGVAARQSAERATGELLSTIVTAGLTVALASAALAAADLGFLRAFGPGLALAVLVGLLVAITFLPALLAICGAATFWPRRPRVELAPEAAAEAPAADRPARRTRNRWLALAVRRPVWVAGVCTVLLLAAASGLAGLRVGQTLIRGLPEDAQARQAYAAAGTGFAAGVVAPSVLMLEGVGADQREPLADLQRELEDVRGVALVVGPGQLPIAPNLGAVYSPDGRATRMVIVLRDDPLGAAAISTLRRIRSALPGLLDATGLDRARWSLAGDTALAEETVSGVGADLARVAPLTLLVVLAVLAIFLRSLLAPLYLVAASVLALCASLGLTVYVFQDLLGHGELTFYVPFTASVLLAALGSDYNVFLAGRIWDAARERPWKTAVLEGGAGAATAITVAGLVLALSFALLALVDLRPFRELAFAMTAGLLIDAFIVRTLLIPALIALAGPRSAWPNRALASARA
jgi:RND superfamily putative drug exporter